MVFYDGNFFKQGQIFFRYKENLGWFSLPQLHNLFERYIAEKQNSVPELTKVVGAHYYDGRTSPNASSDKALRRERGFEMSLITAGIVPHYLPLREVERDQENTDMPQFRLAQKGVDVELALDVLDYAHDDRFDIAVLVSGDQDFVPLVRKVTSLGKQVLVAYFHIDQWTDEAQIYHRPTYCSTALIKAASLTLNFNEILQEEDYWESDSGSLFFMPRR